MNINIDVQNSKKGKYSGWWRIALLAAAGLVLFTFQSAPESFFTLNGISPNLLLPFVMAVAIFFGEYIGAGFGLFAGILLDLYVTPSIAFNAVFLMITGCLCGLLVRHFFTRNIGTALLLSLIEIVMYFLICWLIYRVIPGYSGKMYYLVRYSLPSMIYSWVFIFPWYFIAKWIKGKNKNEK